MNLPNNIHPASFRDPAGYMYKSGDVYYRYVSACYKKHYEHALSHGVFRDAVRKKILLNFEEVTDEKLVNNNDYYKVLLPKQISFLSYPWEWSFEQLKEAALVTLQLCRIALEKGMILKDATPLNLQYIEGRFQWIDHLSFEIYNKGDAWVAYRQFCEMFLNPLLIASYSGMEVHRTMLAYPNGISAKQTATLLPFKCRWHLHIQLHVFLQARIQFKKNISEHPSRHFSAEKVLRILDSLQSCIESLDFKSINSVWSNYYNETIISNAYLSEKKEIVENLLQSVAYETVLDAGCNDGAMAKLCHAHALVVAADADSTCIDHLYKTTVKAHINNINAVVLDLTHPSGWMGWDNQEQPAFFSRKEYDLIFAFALIHHLAIGSNIPLDKIAALFSRAGRQLLIEFVPKEDPKVQEILVNRADIFSHYTQHGFEAAFSQYFNINRIIASTTTKRIMYHMTRK